MTNAVGFALTDREEARVLWRSNGWVRTQGVVVSLTDSRFWIVRTDCGWYA